MALCNSLRGGFNKMGVGLLSQVASDRMKGNGLKLYYGRFGLIIRKKILHGKGCQAGTCCPGK